MEYFDWSIIDRKSNITVLAENTQDSERMIFTLLEKEYNMYREYLDAYWSYKYNRGYITYKYENEMGCF